MRKTIQEIEQDIEELEIWLSVGGRMPMNQWSRFISKYNAAKIKLSQMKGEQPQVIYYKPEHIINK